MVGIVDSPSGQMIAANCRVRACRHFRRALAIALKNTILFQ
jgi:hypothetical protein